MHIGIRTLNAACLAGFVTLAAGGGFVAVWSARAKADRMARENLAAQRLLGEYRKAQSALARLDASLKANQIALETLRKRLPESEPIGRFLADLDALVREANVKVNKLTPGQSVQETICTRTPLAFSCEGSFAGLHAVVHGLEHMDRLMHVERVSIRGGYPSNRCSMDIACSVYGSKKREGKPDG